MRRCLGNETKAVAVLVDDSAPVRRSLRSLLKALPKVEICGEATEGIGAIEKAKGLRPALNYPRSVYASNEWDRSGLPSPHNHAGSTDHAV